MSKKKNIYNPIVISKGALEMSNKSLDEICELIKARLINNVRTLAQQAFEDYLNNGSAVVNVKDSIEEDPDAKETITKTFNG